LASIPGVRIEGKEVRFADSMLEPITIKLLVKEPHQLVYLARLVAHLGYEEVHFEGALLWITAWGIWNSLVESVGLRTLEQIRRSFSENRSLEAAPATRFRHDEFVEAVACLVQPLLIGWDAYYVPRWSYGQLDYFVFVSHDSYLQIFTRTPETRSSIV